MEVLHPLVQLVLYHAETQQVAGGEFSGIADPDRGLVGSGRRGEGASPQDKAGVVSVGLDLEGQQHELEHHALGGFGLEQIFVLLLGVRLDAAVLALHFDVDLKDGAGLEGGGADDELHEVEGGGVEGHEVVRVVLTDLRWNGLLDEFTPCLSAAGV